MASLVTVMACSSDGSHQPPGSPPVGDPATEAGVDAQFESSLPSDGADAFAEASPDAGLDASTDVLPSCLRGQRILVGETSNARDLGCTPARDGHVRPRIMFRGSHLASLSTAGCDEFRSLGIRTVIDLRVASERTAAPDASCVSEQASIVLAPLPIPYGVGPDDYIADLDAKDSMKAALTVLSDADAYPVYFHCAHGRDRSGVFAAVVLSTLGTPPASIMEEYELTREAGLSTYPASLQAVLDEIARRGGIESHLAALGLAPGYTQQLHDIAVAR